MRYELRGFGIDVILLEPGLIRTEFGEAALASIVQSQTEAAGDGAAAAGDGDPYAQFNATVGAVTKGAYDGPMRRLGSGPDRVAKVIEKALKRRRPPTRIKITPSARLLIATRRLLPRQGLGRGDARSVSTAEIGPPAHPRPLTARAQPVATSGTTGCGRPTSKPCA